MPNQIATAYKLCYIIEAEIENINDTEHREDRDERIERLMPAHFFFNSVDTEVFAIIDTGNDCKTPGDRPGDNRLIGRV